MTIVIRGLSLPIPFGIVCLCAAALAMLLPVPAQSVDYTNYIQIFSFGGTNGASPAGDLVEGSDGFLYGTTTSGGPTNTVSPAGMGTIFRVRKDGSGYQVLHLFGTSQSDGWLPNGGLVETTNGSLYGTTVQGGLSGLGTVFRIDKDGGNYSIIKHFAGGDRDGSSPGGGLLCGSDGALYGTASSGGWANSGLVFKIDSNAGGYSIVALLQEGYGDIASSPTGSLIEGSNGKLYGASTEGWRFVWPAGDRSTHGALFTVGKDGTGLSIDPNPFYADLGTPQFSPNGPLADGGDGYFYGTSTWGFWNCTSIFRCSATAPSWDFSILANTEDQLSNPAGGLTKHPDGTLYGTASASISHVVGTPLAYGGVFSISASSSNLVCLKLFSADGDGQAPRGKLLLASDNGLYGVTSAGGSAGFGTIYALYPDSRSWFTAPFPNANRILCFNASGAAGVAFRLQFATNILQPAWIDITTNTSNPEGDLSLPGVAAVSSNGFYRLVSP